MCAGGLFVAIARTAALRMPAMPLTELLHIVGALRRQSDVLPDLLPGAVPSAEKRIKQLSPDVFARFLQTLCNARPCSSVLLWSAAVGCT
jgi:hypothetical protein